DIGWTELLVVAVIIIFAFGPEDIPKIMYNLGRIVRRFRYMRYALSSQFEDFMEKAEASGKVPPKPTPEIASLDKHPNDEGDADEYLMDMIPVPENVVEKDISNDDEPAEQQRNPDAAADGR